MKRSCGEDRAINSYGPEAKRQAKVGLIFLVRCQIIFLFLQILQCMKSSNILRADRVFGYNKEIKNSTHLLVRLMVMSFPELSRLKCS